MSKEEKIDDIIAGLKSVNFNPNDAIGTRIELVREIKYKAGLVNLIDTCMAAKTILTNLSSVNKTIVMKRAEFDELKKEVSSVDAVYKRKTNAADAELKEHVETERTRANDKIKGFNDNVKTKKAESENIVAVTERTAKDEIKVINRKVADAGKKLGDIESQLANAETKREEMLSTLT